MNMKMDLNMDMKMDTDMDTYTENRHGHSEILMDFGHGEKNLFS